MFPNPNSIINHNWGFPGDSVVKNLPASAGDVSSIPGWEDPLEEEMAPLSSILVWKIPWTKEPSGLPSVRSQRVSVYTVHGVTESRTLLSDSAWGWTSQLKRRKFWKYLTLSPRQCPFPGPLLCIQGVLCLRGGNLHSEWLLLVVGIQGPHHGP